MSLFIWGRNDSRMNLNLVAKFGENKKLFLKFGRKDRY